LTLQRRALLDTRRACPPRFAATLFLVAKFSLRQLDAMEKVRANISKGATGEASVALVLSNLSDEYKVINDLATPFGNLDHVVVGPTGVYILETKNWRGIVSSDGKGEL